MQNEEVVGSAGWGGWIGSMDEAVESDGWLLAEIEEEGMDPEMDRDRVAAAGLD